MRVRAADCVVEMENERETVPIIGSISNDGRGHMEKWEDYVHIEEVQSHIESG